MFVFQGAICLDTLGKQWSPVQTIKTALLSLRLLLECPNPSDPQDAQVAQEMLNAPRQWAQNARDWAVRYAGAAPSQELDLSKYAENGASMPAPDMAQCVPPLPPPIMTYTRDAILSFFLSAAEPCC